MDRVEANLARITALLAQTMERQSAAEELQDRTHIQIQALTTDLESMKDDFRLLLKAQVLLTEAQQVSEGKIAALADSHRAVDEKLRSLTEKLSTLADMQEVLRQTVDEMIRGRKPS